MGVFIVTSSLKGVYFCVKIRIKNIFIVTATQAEKSHHRWTWDLGVFTSANSYSCNVMTELQNCKQRRMREVERNTDLICQCQVALVNKSDKLQ